MYSFSGSQIAELLESAVCCGIARYESLKEPHKDKLSKKEASDYVRSLCTKLGLYMPRKENGRYIKKSGEMILKYWIDDGLIKGERGKAINSPILFSKVALIETANRIKTTLFVK